MGNLLLHNIYICFGYTIFLNKFLNSSLRPSATWWKNANKIRFITRDTSTVTYHKDYMIYILGKTSLLNCEFAIDKPRQL